MDITLNYIEKGSGEPFVLLHGNGEDSTCFSSQIAFFSRYYHVIAPDTRGHGLSARGKAPFTLEQFADDLFEFLSLLGIGKAHILGFSDGGNIAILFALKYPQMVDKLILNGANLFPLGCKKSVNEWVEREYTEAMKSGDIHTMELMSLMRDEPNIEPEELRTITTPTLVIAGTDDMILRSHTRLIARNIPHSTLSFIEGDHFIVYRKPEEFNRVVLDFLTS